VLHSYGVALIRKEKGERSIAEKEVLGVRIASDGRGGAGEGRAPPQ
jgi:hypothetical protein